MSEFNLVDEAWIPVRLSRGNRAELGIRETLLRAKEIAEIEDQSPLVVASLHRLLLAVLYRALKGPTDIDQAEELFASGFPANTISEYLNQWHARFWLFDEVFPFWQVADFEPREWRSWTALAAEHNADNAKVLFDHSDVTLPDSISHAAAARWLAACQTFSVSAGKSELAHTGGAPSATAIQAFPLGMSLHDTLLCLLLPQIAVVTAEDSAVWERAPQTVAVLRTGKKRPALGFADLYTWQSRAILLRQDGNAVKRIAFASGVGFESGALNDPTVAYRMDDKLGRVAMQFRERGIWRDFDALLPDASDLPPAVVGHTERLTAKDKTRRPRALAVLGQAANKAKIEFWRAERFALPGSVTADRVTRTELRQLLNIAEASQSALWRSCQSFATDMLSHGTRQAVKKDVAAFVKQMGVIEMYWSAVERQFHALLSMLAAGADFDITKAAWLKSIRDAIEQSWRVHSNAILASDAWTLRAFARADRIAQHELAKLNTGIAELNNPEPAA